MKIEIISGSSRQNSVTYRVALLIKKYLEQHTTHEVEIIDLREWDLPPLQSVFSSAEYTPEKFKPLSERMFSADGFILVSPEYNGSYSPALKNLLDHYPKQHHKPFAIATAAPGTLGGIRAAVQLQTLVNALFGIGSPYMLIVPQIERRIDAEGTLLDESFQNTVHNFITEYLWLAEKLVNKKQAA